MVNPSSYMDDERLSMGGWKFVGDWVAGTCLNYFLVESFVTVIQSHFL